LANKNPVAAYRFNYWERCIKSESVSVASSIPWGPADPYTEEVRDNPCEHLSLDELRRADAEASAASQH
jgi:hypothetical protein